MEIKLDEIKSYFEQNKDKDEVKNYLADLSKVTVDKLKKAIESDDDVKKFYFAQTDIIRDKGIESWKENNLKKLIDDEVAKRNPKETEEQKALRELTQRFENLEKEKKRETLKNYALNYATEKNIPSKFIDRFIGNDEDETKQNLESFRMYFNEAVTSATQGKFKEFGRNVKNQSDTKRSTLNWDMVSKMSKEELLKNEDEIQKLMQESNS